MDVEHVGRAAIAVGNRTYDAVEGVVVAGGIHGGGTAAFDHAKAADLPSSQDAVHEPIPTVPPALAVSEGKLIHPDTLEDVGAVKVGRRVVQPAIIQIKRCTGGPERARGRSYGSESWIKRSSVGRFRPHIARLESQSV